MFESRSFTSLPKICTNSNARAHTHIHTSFTKKRYQPTLTTRPHRLVVTFVVTFGAIVVISAECNFYDQSPSSPPSDRKYPPRMRECDYEILRDINRPTTGNLRDWQYFRQSAYNAILILRFIINPICAITDTQRTHIHRRENFRSVLLLSPPIHPASQNVLLAGSRDYRAAAAQSRRIDIARVPFARARRPPSRRSLASLSRAARATRATVRLRVERESTRRTVHSGDTVAHSVRRWCASYVVVVSCRFRETCP